MAKQMTFGVIVGNRGFFPDQLAKTGREEILRVLAADGIRTIALTHGRIQVRRRRNADGSAFVRQTYFAGTAMKSTASLLHFLISAKSGGLSMPCGTPP